MHPIYTIGHSSLPSEAFVALLKQHRIQAIADVRSNPRSHRHPHFSREVLQSVLEREGIRYVALGQELGARRTERECYVDGQAQYEAIARLPAFNEGIERALKGAESYCIALMCAEHDPLTCHRSILVCRSLSKHQPDLRHILRDGSVEPHAAAELRLMEEEGVRTDQGELFAGAAMRVDPLERAYTKRGRRIAYRQIESDHEALHDRIHAEIG